MSSVCTCNLVVEVLEAVYYEIRYLCLVCFYSDILYFVVSAGKYIAYSVKLPVLGQRQARGGAAGG